MAKEIVLRFASINKRQKFLIESSGGIGYFGQKKEILQSLPRSGLVLLSVIINCRVTLLLQSSRWKRQIGLLDRLDFGKKG
jgi:hypothetical protein